MGLEKTVIEAPLDTKKSCIFFVGNHHIRFSWSRQEFFRLRRDDQSTPSSFKLHLLVSEILSTITSTGDAKIVREKRKFRNCDGK